MFNTIKSLFGKLFAAKDHSDCPGCQAVEQEAKHTAVMSAPYKVEPQPTPIPVPMQVTAEQVKKMAPVQKATPTVKTVKKKAPAKKTTKKVTK